MPPSAAPNVHQGNEPAPSPTDYSFNPSVTSFRLDNGLRVVVLPDMRSEAVNHMVWYRNGSIDDPAGKSGIAHFLEHLMFKGTPRFPAEAFRKTISRSGGAYNAFTGPSMTCYFETVTADILPKCMAFEADRMANLQFGAEAASTERDVILAERGMTIEANPGRLLDEKMIAAVFGPAPEGRPVIGWRHEIEGLTHDDARAHYERFYAPENALLLVAGGVDPDEVRDLAIATYGAVPARAVKRRERSVFPPLAAEMVAVQHPDVRSPEARRAFRVPCGSAADRSLAYAFRLIAFYLSGTESGHLMRILAGTRQVASTASSAYVTEVFPDETLFLVSASPTDTVSIDTLERELDALLGELAQSGIPDDALARCKRHSEARSMFGLDNLRSLSHYFGSMLTLGQPVEEIVQWQHRLQAVTPADIRRAAALLSPARAVRARLLPGSATAPLGA